MKIKKINEENKVIYKEIGAKIRAARLAKKLSIKEFADMVGIKSGSISKYELGQDRIQIDALIKILNTLDVDINALFSDYTKNSISGMLSEIQQKELKKISNNYDKLYFGETGFDNIFCDDEYEVDHFYLQRDVERFNYFRTEFIMLSSDDSMFPAIKKNSFVGISSGELKEGQIYLFYFPKIGCVFKRISQINNNAITIVSDNSNMMIKDRTIKIEDINELAIGSVEEIKTELDKNKNYILGNAVWVLQNIY